MKKFKLVLATSAVLLGSISVLATSNFTKGNEGFTLTSAIEGNKEVVGVKRAMVEEGDKAVFTEGEGTSLQVSPAMTQVVTNEDGTTNLRFVAAVKADLTGSAVNAVKAVMPGDVGFHVSYGEKDVTYDVEHAYSSMVASGNFYYANEYSSWYGGSNNKSITDWLGIAGFEDNEYNLFVALEVENIPEESLDTLFKVQTYVRSEDGTYEYSKYTKLADATNLQRTQLSVTNSEGTTVQFMEANSSNPDERITFVDLKQGDKVAILDSYGRKINNFENYDYIKDWVEEGTITIPWDGNYAFVYKNNIEGVWVTVPEDPTLLKVSFEFELTWDGIGDVYLNDKKMEYDVETNKYYVEIASEVNISTLKLDFSQDNVWWHNNNKTGMTFELGKTYQISGVSFTHIDNGEKYFNCVVTEKNI